MLGLQAPYPECLGSLSYTIRIQNITLAENWQCHTLIRGEALLLLDSGFIRNSWRERRNRQITRELSTTSQHLCSDLCEIEWRPRIGALAERTPFSKVGEILDFLNF